MLQKIYILNKFCYLDVSIHQIILKNLSLIYIYIYIYIYNYKKYIFHKSIEEKNKYINKINY